MSRQPKLGWNGRKQKPQLIAELSSDATHGRRVKRFLLNPGFVVLTFRIWVLWPVDLCLLSGSISPNLTPWGSVGLLGITVSNGRRG